jgi:UPF0716 protein FxsA
MAIAILLLLVIPVVELYIFVQVANAIGFWNALGLVILTSLFGIWLVKRAGVRMWARFNEQRVAQAPPSRQVADGMCLLVAGALFVVPGFLTDALGLLLLLPPVRSLISTRLIRRYTGGGQVRIIRATYDGPTGWRTDDLRSNGSRSDVIETGATEQQPPRPEIPGP